jgi:hypothetical protein
LTGTWEVIGSRLGDVQKSVIVTISPTYLIISSWISTMTVVQRGNAFEATLSRNGRQGAFFTAVRTDGPGDTGIIPVPLFGTWEAHSSSPGCAIQAGPDSASANCVNVSDFPFWMRQGSAATLTATRTRPLSSVFGDFGGEWTFTTNAGASCTFRFEGSTISAACLNARETTGTASLTIDGDTLHGSTDKGIEFTGQRL